MLKQTNKENARRLYQLLIPALLVELVAYT